MTEHGAALFKVVVLLQNLHCNTVGEIGIIAPAGDDFIEQQ